MITRQIFEPAMAAIADRCAKPPDANQLAMYYAYLSPRLSDQEFLEAAKSVWSSAEFFPPPVAFLKIRAHREWDLVAELADMHQGRHTPPGFIDKFNALDDTTRRTLKALGGLPNFKEKQLQKDPVRAMEKFRTEYTTVLETEAGESARRDRLDESHTRRIGS